MKRLHYIQKVTQGFRMHPVVALLGPRQCGKTTLAQMYAESVLDGTPIHRFDLEDPTDVERLMEAKLALSELKGLIIIDEVQCRPELFPVLRVLADQKRGQQQYLILGSASRELLRQSSESLAGRIAYIELTPFSYLETGELSRLWERGGFPLSYLAETLIDSLEWRKFYIKTFLEQDIPNLGLQIPPYHLRRFWAMLAHYHGNIFNASELGRSLSISDVTARRYLDILAGVFMVRQLMPWFENLGKRQVKSPKIYFRDSGILHSLLNINNLSDLQKHPKLGASWEGFALEEIIRFLEVDPQDCYFWATHGGAELDLMVLKDGKRLGFEFKYADAPKMTKSMHTALADLKLDELNIIYPGEHNFPIAEGCRVIGLKSYLQQDVI